MSSDADCLAGVVPRRALSRSLIARCTLVAAVLLLCVSAGSAASDKKPVPYALIFGTVWTPNDVPAPGVTIKIRRADEKKARWTHTSDGRGEFAQRVPVGPADYLVWAEVKGHKGPVGETKVHIEYDERQDIGLHLSE